MASNGGNWRINCLIHKHHHQQQKLKYSHFGSQNHFSVPEFPKHYKTAVSSSGIGQCIVSLSIKSQSPFLHFQYSLDLNFSRENKIEAASVNREPHDGYGHHHHHHHWCWLVALGNTVHRDHRPHRYSIRLVARVASSKGEKNKIKRRTTGSSCSPNTDASLSLSLSLPK